MDFTVEIEPEALWNDLIETATNPSSVSIFKACRAVSFHEGELSLETDQNVVATLIQRNRAEIEAQLSELAFQPVQLQITKLTPGSIERQESTTPRPSSGLVEQQDPHTAGTTSTQSGFVSTTHSDSYQHNSAATATTSVPTSQLGDVPSEVSYTKQSAEAQRELEYTQEVPPAQSGSYTQEGVTAHSSFGGAQTIKLNPDELIMPEGKPLPSDEVKMAALRRRMNNPLTAETSSFDSKLTFERFVKGPENEYAYQAAVQVANGTVKGYNPLFIYGRSGVGKTHLLRAIQNYVQKYDPMRLCVYKDATSFISDYTESMKHRLERPPEVLARNYQDIDILIIDDIQKLAGKEGTISFFFDTFNALISQNKQIVLAADRSPSEIGLERNTFDERVISRFISGFMVNIDIPSYELKLNLISNFCQHIIEDMAQTPEERAFSFSNELIHHMAQLSGNNIRMIEGFCQRMVVMGLRLQQQEQEIDSAVTEAVAREIWPATLKMYTSKDIQKAVARALDVTHDDIIGSKRTKNIALARHIAIWLEREMCDKTLTEIGIDFGGRSHATIMHSLEVVDEMIKHDKVFYTNVMKIRDAIKK